MGLFGLDLVIDDKGKLGVMIREDSMVGSHD